uniref:Uncharacterized protein n=1 Tax=Anguilla anguilla TaxID=7936 RepID=A0A0E9VIU5_ANGAN
MAGYHRINEHQRPSRMVCSDLTLPVQLRYHRIRKQQKQKQTKKTKLKGF